MRTVAPCFSLKPVSPHPRLLLGLVAALLVLTFAGAVPAAAQSLPLYTIAGLTGQFSVDPMLRTIDPLTGETLSEVEITLVGEVVRGGTGLAIHPDTGILFALLNIEGQTTRLLVTIDPDTGAATLIGDTGLHLANIAFSDDGTLWAVTGDQQIITATNPATLFTINTATAIPTLRLALGTEADDGEAIAFNPVDGMLYHVSFNNRFEPIDITDPDNPVVGANIGFSGDTPGEITTIIHWSGDMFLLASFNDLFIVKITGESRSLGLNALDHSAKGLVFAGTPPACPQALYGAAHTGRDIPSLFYSIDPATGDATLIGPIGFERVNGLAFLNDGLLLGVGETQDGNNTVTTIQVDPCTGLGTTIGDTLVGEAEDLSTRPSDDVLFGVLDFELATVDTTTGEATNVGAINTGCCGWGMAFDPADDTLFLAVADEPDTPVLFTIDDPDNSGDVTAVATMTIPAEAETEAARVNSMTFDGATGDLLGSLVDGGRAYATGPFHWLVNINKTTADVALIGETQIGLNAIASASAFADIEIVKDVSQSTAVVGQRLSYFITVTNNGVADATNVVVQDPLPADFSVDTIIASQGTCSGTTTITCELGDIAAGDSVDIELRGEATDAAALSNTATVISDQGDINPANNSSTADSASASFTVSATPATLNLSVGGSGTLTVTVTVTDGSVDEEIDLECLVLTPNILMTCVFNPPTVTPGSGSATSTATVKVISFVAMQAPPPSSRPAAPLYAVWLGLPVVAFFGTLVFGGRRKQFAFALAVGLLVLAMLPLAGCNNAEEVAPEPTIVNFQVVGELGAHSVNSSTVTMTVN